ncbi:NrsF family protein [Ochrobactrum sp. EDr1-4]|uniref:NrsF family protein n=1 Tax=Ochrobactrum sp. EDr1-4 TaxID=3368622 RepID=UPI003BA203AB
MLTDVINQLVDDMKPVSRQAMQKLFLKHAIFGLVMAASIMIVLLGVRHDLTTAMFTPTLWVKFGYAASLLAIMIPPLLALSRPVRSTFPWKKFLLLITCLTFLAVLDMFSVLPNQKKALVIGDSAWVCSGLIMVLAFPILLALLSAIRKLAPYSSTMAGLAAGIVSGGISVFIYSFHCPEPGIPFVAIWYTGGVVGTGVIGAISGRYFLRW